MTEEIKEILENIKKQNKWEGVEYFRTPLSNDDADKLLKCITNLQQENEKLKYNARGQVNDYFKDKYADEVLKNAKLQQGLDKANDIIEKDRQFYKCRMDEYAELKKENERLKELNICVGCDNNPDYKSRCLKAIEEINYWGIDKEHNDNSAMRLALGNILNILIGSDAK